MEYFLLRNLGYDGILFQRFRTKEEALEGYQFDLKDYRDNDSNRGIMLIEGQVILSEDELSLFPYDD